MRKDAGPCGRINGAFVPEGVELGFCGQNEPHPTDIQQVRQVHGTNITSVGSGNANHGEAQVADALWTTEPQVTIGVKTADCLPVVCVSTGTPFILAAHAGWRGLCAGLLHRCLVQAETAGVPRSRLRIFLGPAIGRERFEVGPEVVVAFCSPVLDLNRDAAALCLAKGRDDRWHVDLHAAAALAFIRDGVRGNQIVVHRTCTYTSPHGWNSYRRDGRGHGSNWSWVRLTG